MENQQLNFEGGPWLLRNGETVNYISFNENLKYYISDNWVKDSFEWDKDGNFRNRERPDLDIVENLDNWKYNRKDYAD